MAISIIATAAMRIHFDFSICSYQMLYNNDGYTSQTNQDVPHGKPRIDAFVVFIIDTHSYLIDCTGTSNSCPKMFNNIVESGRNMIVVFWRNASYIARPFKSSCSWLDISANPYLSKSSYTSPRVRKSRTTHGIVSNCPYTN